LLIDLHTHSDCSDGTLSPAQLVQLAVAAGVTVLALTDHDSTAGVERARQAAAEAGIHLVPGVEVSASWRRQDIHVLGLWVDPHAEVLRTALVGQLGRRRARIAAMCERLTRVRLPGAALQAAVEASATMPTRSHLAQAMLAQGLVDKADHAFKKYLNPGRPGHVAADWPALDVVVGWIRAAGGVAVMAHPSRYKLSSSARQRLLTDFVAAGGEALEVLSGGNGAQHAAGCAALALRHGLKGSVGSDFHSPQFAWNPLGRSLKLPDSITPVWHGRLS
jgi:predicted metal-dependent phosphoesterase TrpH